LIKMYVCISKVPPHRNCRPGRPPPLLSAIAAGALPVDPTLWRLPSPEPPFIWPHLDPPCGFHWRHSHRSSIACPWIFRLESPLQKVTVYFAFFFSVIYFLYIMFKCVVGLSSTILVMYVCGETYPMTPMPVWVRM